MKILTIAATMTALALTPAWAQQPQPHQGKAPVVDAQAHQENLVGCLAHEESAYTLKTSNGMVELKDEKSYGLEAHVGKTIRVTGSPGTTEAGKTVFEVIEVEVMSPKCES